MKFTSSLNVAMPATLSSSRSLNPSTVKSPVISTSDLKVEAPDTLTVPATSRFAVGCVDPIPTSVPTQRLAPILTFFSSPAPPSICRMPVFTSPKILSSVPVYVTNPVTLKSLRV